MRLYCKIVCLELCYSSILISIIPLIFIYCHLNVERGGDERNTFHYLHIIHFRCVVPESQSPVSKKEMHSKVSGTGEEIVGLSGSSESYTAVGPCGPHLPPYLLITWR
jgi:hypothetical protein